MRYQFGTSSCRNETPKDITTCDILWNSTGFALVSQNVGPRARSLPAGGIPAGIRTERGLKFRADARNFREQNPERGFLARRKILYRLMHTPRPIAAQVKRDIRKTEFFEFSRYTLMHLDRFCEFSFQDLDPRDIFMHPHPELLKAQLP